MDFDNIGDFLYLILLVVFGIVGAITKKKKKPAQGTTSEPVHHESSETGKDLFDSLFPTLNEEEPIMQEEIQAPEPKQEWPKQFQSSVSGNKKDQKLDVVPDEEGVSVTHTNKKHILHSEIGDHIKKHSPIKDSEIGDSNNGIDIDLSGSEELKKAIIYSEIIKAKYIDH